MTKLRSAGLLVSVAAATALLSAPIAFADGGHGDGNRGRDSGEHAVVTTQNPATAVDMDRNDDAMEQAQPQQVVEQEPEVNDLNDDND